VSGKPRISVLLPLQDAREAGAECVEAWTNQRADPDSFEVIALAPGEDQALEASVRPLLREHDRWIVAPGKDEYELFNLGAQEGSGEFVFVTEAHCVPEPDCLGAMLEELDRTGAPGVRGTSVPEARGDLGVLERDAFEDALRVEEDPGHWRKILIHSLAIRRNLYLDAGGLPPVYGDFAPWPLAIALHAEGQRLVFSPRPRVRHVYDGDLGQLGDHVRSFGRGEMLYRGQIPGRVAGRYLDPAVEWEQRLGHTRAGARRALRAAIALRHPGTLRDGLRHAGVAVVGPRLSIARARAGAALAARRARRSTDPERSRRGFREFWRLTSRRGRLTGVAKLRLGEVPAPAPAQSFDLSSSVAGRAIGLFHLESVRGGRIRWTAPLASFKVNVPGDGMARARIELLPFERPLGAPGAEPGIAVDNRIVPLGGDERTLEFEIPSGEHWISVACRPMLPRRYDVDDPRALGVPIRKVTFEPA
jgi:hypothetical protein